MALDKLQVDIATLMTLQAEVDSINKIKAKNDSMKKMLDISQQIEALPRYNVVFSPP